MCYSCLLSAPAGVLREGREGTASTIAEEGADVLARVCVLLRLGACWPRTSPTGQCCMHEQGVIGGVLHLTRNTAVDCMHVDLSRTAL